MIIKHKDHLQYINSNPKAPNLRTTTKIHKQGHPIRPIVNYTQAPAYKIQKFLSKYLKEKLIIEHKYNIINSNKLATTLKTLKINKQMKFISLDIKDMYSNIPVQETIKIIQNQLNIINTDQEETEQLISLLRSSLDQNYFEFDNQYYLQSEGLPMGGPLSSIISEIYLQDYENKFIENLKGKYNIIYYGRYVDDILIIHENINNNQSNNILEEFNNNNQHLQFTLEEEVNKKINFLDLTLIRYNKHIEFDIYRKPTTSKLSINNFSSHPTTYKLANFRFLLNRLNNIPLTKNRRKNEFHKILEVAQFNNFSKHDIIKLNYNIKNNIELKNKTTLKPLIDKPKQYNKITYFGNISQKIKNIFSKYNVNISFSIPDKNKNSLKNKTPTCESQICNNSGIYKLTCECQAMYIGKTSRKFTQRIYEHRHSFLYNIPERSNFAAHMLHPSHKLIPFTNNFQIIKIINDRKYIDVWEDIQIIKYRQKYKLINEQIPNVNNPLYKLLLTFQNIYTLNTKELKCMITSKNDATRVT